jgi:hypothetical protein
VKLAIIHKFLNAKTWIRDLHFREHTFRTGGSYNHGRGVKRLEHKLVDPGFHPDSHFSRNRGYKSSYAGPLINGSPPDDRSAPGGMTVWEMFMR